MKTTLNTTSKEGNTRVFHLLDQANYQAAMTSTLRRLLAEMPLSPDGGK